jgi:parallel beta-helix repeat protein
MCADWFSPGVFSYEIRVCYNNTLLNAVEAEIPEGHWLTPNDPQKIFVAYAGVINNDEGYVDFSVTLIEPELGKTGGGVIAEITFNCLSPGETVLDLCNVMLVKPDLLTIYRSTEYDVQNGYVSMRSEHEAMNWTVDDDGPADFSSIQEALDAANLGDTIYVKIGTYYEHIVINKNNLTLIGESRYTTIIDGNGTGNIIHVVSNYANIAEFTIQNTIADYPGGSGIFLQSSTGSVVCNNVIVDCNMYAISLENSRDCTLNNNVITSDRYGIWLDECDRITLANNSGSFLAYGIYLFWSDNCTLRENNMSANLYNLLITGCKLSHYIHDIDMSNRVDGGRTLYLVNKSNIVVSPSTFPDLGYVGFISSRNVTIKDLVLTNNNHGVLFVNTTDSIISNITSCKNAEAGIYLQLSSSRNLLVGNNVTDSKSGITLYQDCDGNTISNNILLDNSIYGISCGLDADNNMIMGNWIGGGEKYGISLARNRNNTLIENTINDCGLYGIQFAESFGNFIHHNNFVNNPTQVYDFSWDRSDLYPSRNFWDDGYPSGGNYWSDHMSPDELKGLSQDVPGSDGISDVAYIIDNRNEDLYPLMMPLVCIPKFEFSPQKPTVSEQIEFNASSSYSRYGNIKYYEWRFGDGNNAITSGPCMKYSYAEPGNYTVALKATDDKGLWNTTSLGIKVYLITDLNLDGIINILDISMVAMSFGTKEGDENYNVFADLDENGEVNIIDLAKVATEFGKTV